MNSLARLGAAAVVLFSMAGAALADITIDATALTVPLFRIFPQPGPVIGPLSTTVSHSLALAAGDYIFVDQASNQFEFNVDSSGNVSYPSNYEPYLSGAGTPVLVVDGFTITIDASMLTDDRFRVSPITPSVSTDDLLTITGIAGGSYSIIDSVSNGTVIEIGLDGLIHYNPGFEDFLDGAGTTHLFIRGFDFAVDATSLTSPRFRVDGITDFASSDIVQPITGLPGNSYLGRDGASNAFLFSVDEDGFIQYVPGHEDFLDGADTTYLFIRGFDFTVDATALTTSLFRVDGITSFASPAVPLSITGIPGASYVGRDAASNAFLFEIDEDGFVRYVPGHEDFLDGFGTTTLAIVGFEITVDTRGVSPSLLSTYTIGGYLRLVDSTVVHCFRGLPGASYLFFGLNSLFLFWVDEDGKITNLPPVFEGQPLTGNGTPYLLLGLNTAPLADAGMNLSILPSEQNMTLIAGSTADVDCDYLIYRWYEETAGGDVLVFGPAYALSGEAFLDLATLPPLSVGEHTFRLEVADPYGIATDTVLVTVTSSSPMLAPSGGGVYEIGLTNDVVLSATISDNDGDLVSYEWKLVNQVLFSGSVLTVSGGTPVSIPDEFLATTFLGLGNHMLDLVASDGMNSSMASVEVSVIDTSMPTLSPVASTMMLFPPTHSMVPVTIQANVDDNSGGVTLSVTVTSSEPPNFDGDGNTVPDIEIVSVDSVTGVILLNLRAERSGKGNGRTYTVTITATDGSANSSTSTLVIKAPHNKKA